MARPEKDPAQAAAHSPLKPLGRPPIKRVAPAESGAGAPARAVPSPAMSAGTQGRARAQSTKQKGVKPASAGAGKGAEQMYVNTNVAALNAWQNLYNTQQSMNNTLEQLSSGNRINTAADDPAGLAISQQMQSQIGGLNQAYQNSQSGISLLQTADGALGQIQNILQSMRSLASEAATATMNSTDTQNLQVEMNQYAQEITQITNTTQFNDINLLAGGFQNQNIQVGANQGQSLAISLSAADAYSLGVSGQQATIANGATALTNGDPASSVGLTNTTSDTLTSSTTAWSLSAVTQSAAGTYPAITSVGGAFTGAQKDTLNFSISTDASGNQTVTYTDNSNSSPLTLAVSGGKFTVDGLTFTMSSHLANSSNYTASFSVTPASTSITSGSPNSGISATVNGPIQTGQQVSLTNSSSTESLTFDASSAVNTASTTAATYSALTTSASGSETVTQPTAITATLTVKADGSAATVSNGQVTTAAVASTGLDVTSQTNAATALSLIDTAINTLSTERANVGAYQNRLTFASSNVQTAAQNLTAARGTIMNADMAQQMSLLAQEQVLQQSGVAMLAQANAVPQALLKLLP